MGSAIPVNVHKDIAIVCKKFLGDRNMAVKCAAAKVRYMKFLNENTKILWNNCTNFPVSVRNASARAVFIHNGY